MKIICLKAELEKHDENAEVVLGVWPYVYNIKKIEPRIVVENLADDKVEMKVIIDADTKHVLKKGEDYVS